MVANTIKMQPGPAWMSVSHVQDIKSCLGHVIPESIQSIILDCINFEGRCVYGEMWKEINPFIGLVWGSHLSWSFQVQRRIAKSM